MNITSTKSSELAAWRKSLPTVVNNGPKGEAGINLASSCDSQQIVRMPTAEGYSLSDAVKHQWQRANAIDLRDIMAGKLDAPKEIGEPPTEFVESLQRNGISGEYDFGHLNFALGTVSESLDIAYNIDTLASVYAAAKLNITKNFSGEEQASSLSRLEELFSSRVGGIAEAFASGVGGFFEENGASGETGKLYDSVINAFHAGAERYLDFAKQNQNFTGLEDAKDAWALRDDAFMAQQLRDRSALKGAIKGGGETKPTESEYYTAGELSAVSRMANEAKKYAFHEKSSVSNQTEEQIGLKYAELLLKGEAFGSLSGISDVLKDRVKTSLKTFLDKDINRQIANMEALRNDPYFNKSRNPSFDKSAIYNVIDKAADTYNQSGDLMKAMLETAAFAERESSAKKNSQVERYDNNRYWKNFYQRTTTYTIYRNGKAMDSGIFTQSKSGVQDMLDRWNGFASSLEGGRALEFTGRGLDRYA